MEAWIDSNRLTVSLGNIYHPIGKFQTSVLVDSNKRPAHISGEVPAQRAELGETYQLCDQFLKNFIFHDSKERLSLC